MGRINSQYRIERDSLGEVSVPSDALYGPQTQRAVNNFPISGLRPWQPFIWSIGAVKLAAAEVNHELGLLEPRLASAISKAAREVVEGKWNDHFVVDPFQAGAGTSHNMNANEVIANRASQILGGRIGEYLVHPNDHVNMCQSTNDVIPTAIRLGCLCRLEDLLAATDSLAQALGKKSVEFDNILKSGRTHLQDAVPIRLGQEFGAYSLSVKRDYDRIEQAGRELSLLGIGGTAVGTGLNAHPLFHEKMVSQLASITGFNLSSSGNLIESMQSMSGFLNYSASLRTLACTLIRIANDLRLLSSGPASGLDEIRLPAVQPGSSIMPGKVNPVMAEMLNMAMYHIIGCDTTIAIATQAGQLELNVMMPVIAHDLFEMVEIMIGSQKAFTEKCINGLQANPLKTDFWLSRNASLVTALNPLIGYDSGAKLAREASDRGLAIQQVAAEKAEMGLLLSITDGKPISRKQVEDAFSDLYWMTEGGLI